MAEPGARMGRSTPVPYADFVELIESLESAPADRGIVLVDTRFRETSHSWHDVLRGVRSAAAAFASAGVRPGQRVLVSLAARLESLCSFFGLVRLGAIPVSVPSPLLSQNRDAHRRRIAELAGSRGIDRILASGDLDGIAGLAGGLPAEAALAVPDPQTDGNVHPPRATPDPDDVAFVQFSSGSTALPKGVRITHRNLMTNLGLIVDNDGRGPDDVVVSWLPLCHDMGLVGCLLSTLVHKNDVVLMDPLCFMARPISWLARISQHRGTTTAVPNFALDVCTERVSDDQLSQHGIDLSSFRYLYCGSEPVSAESVRRFEERFSRYGFDRGGVYPVYGMSETTLIATAPERDDSLVTQTIDGVEIPSVGLPLGDFEIRVRDDAGGSVAAGEVGEIWLRGSSVTPGYLGTDDDAGVGLHDGWLATGDLGALDDRGRLYVTGRKKDLIIHLGRNFYAHDIAARIETLPTVRKGKVFVFGIDVNRKEQIVVMTAPPARGSSDKDKEGSPFSDANAAPVSEYKQDIQRVVLEEFGLPVHDVHVVRRIPKTTSGKIDRGQCIRMYRTRDEAADS